MTHMVHLLTYDSEYGTSCDVIQSGGSVTRVIPGVFVLGINNVQVAPGVHIVTLQTKHKQNTELNVIY